jgi:hypothetical protein
MGRDVASRRGIQRLEAFDQHRIVSAPVDRCLRRCGAILFDQHLPWFVDELGELSTPTLL